MSFQEVNIRQVNLSPVKLISDDWALVTVGNGEKWNTMTVSWGGVGEIWGRDAAFIFIRPQRYTYEFIEKNDLFTISFFGGEYKKELALCGSKSGRDTDKAAATGLIPVFLDDIVSFEQAQTVLVCKKVAFQDLDPSGFLDASIEESYPSKDYHRMYVGQILKTYQKM
jgi:flavin reductase (DIM6/NTAB) family NADH-FMN oxidoreductase RutF